VVVHGFRIHSEGFTAYGYSTEIWTFVLIKQGHIRAGCDDSEIGDQYTFVAIDQDTKLIPSFIIGKRTRENAERFMLDLADRIRAPRPGEPRIRLQISTDGFGGYPAAVDLAFANTVDYGVIIKNFLALASWCGLC
jgi:hypothetical protein